SRGPEAPGFVAVRRKPAEGRDRQGAPNFAKGAFDGRTEPRHRHRREGRRFPDHAKPGRPGDRDCVRDFLPRRSLGPFRPNRWNEQGTPDRAPRPRRGDRGADCRGVFKRAWSNPGEKAKGKAPMSVAAEPRSASAGAGSLTLNLMRLRTFIALFAVILYF